MILVKRLQSVEQASRIFNFFKDFPTISVKAFIINPLDPQAVSVAWLTIQQHGSLHYHQISARQVCEGQTSMQALIGNENILSSISTAAQICPPVDRFSGAAPFQTSDQAQMRRMLASRLTGIASSRYLFDFIHHSLSYSNLWTLDLSMIQVENKSQAEQFVPILPSGMSLPCLFLLSLPRNLVPEIFPSIESTALRIVHGPPSSIRNLGVRRLQWVTFLKVKRSASLELLHLLEALKMTFNLKTLPMEGKTNYLINVDCILQHFLQVSSEAVQPAWCRHLERFMGDGQGLECTEDLLVQLKSSRENLEMEGRRIHSSGFIFK